MPWKILKKGRANKSFSYICAKTVHERKSASINKSIINHNENKSTFTQQNEIISSVELKSKHKTQHLLL